MSSEVEKKITEIELFIFKGKLDEALKKIKVILKKDKLTKEEELQAIVLQSEIYNYKARFPQALKLSNKVLEESKAIDNNLLKANAYLWLAVALYFTSKFKESLEATEKGIDLLQDEGNFDFERYAKCRVFLQCNQGVLKLEFGDLQKGVEIISATHEFAKKSGIDYLIAFSRSLYGFSFVHTGELERVEEHIDGALELANSIGHNPFIIHTYFICATAKQSIRKFDEALEYHAKGIELSLEIGSKALLSGLYIHTGIIYSAQFKLEKALEYYKLALEEISVGKYVLFSNTANIYLMKNEIEKAFEYYQNALKDSKKTSEIRVRPYILHQLVLASMALKDLEKAGSYLRELEELSSESGYITIARYQQIAKVLILKESTSLKDWSEAIEILEKFLSDEKLLDSSKIDALFHLVEIQLKELQVTADQEILTKVKKHMEKIQTFAEDRKQHNLLANLYRLKSQLALVELDAEKAVELLITAKTLAKEKNLQFIVKNIQEEQAKLEQQQNMWNRMKEQKAPLKDALKEVHLDSSVKKLANETILEVRDERTGDIIEYRKLFSLKI